MKKYLKSFKICDLWIWLLKRHSKNVHYRVSLYGNISKIDLRFKINSHYQRILPECQSSRASFLLKCATLLKKRLWHRFFLVNSAKFLRAPFLLNTSKRLLLFVKYPDNMLVKSIWQNSVLITLHVNWV